MYHKTKIKSLGLFITSLVICIQLTSVCYANNNLNTRKQALDIISDFADKFCKKVPFEGSQNNFELKGKVKADLNGIIKKLVDIGIEGAGEYQKKEYQGLLQKDLIEVYKSSTECKIQIWSDLNDKFIGHSSNSSKENTVKEGGQNTYGIQSPIISKSSGGVTVNYGEQVK